MAATRICTTLQATTCNDLPVQIASTRFQDVASHFNVMMTEVVKKQLETEQGFDVREQSKFYKFSYVTGNFDFGFQIDLVLLPEMVLEILPRKRGLKQTALSYCVLPLYTLKRTNLFE